MSMGEKKKKKNNNDVDAIVSALKNHALESMGDIDDYGGDDDDELNSLLSDVISKAQGNKLSSVLQASESREFSDQNGVDEYSDDEIDNYIESIDDELDEVYANDTEKADSIDDVIDDAEYTEDTEDTEDTGIEKNDFDEFFESDDEDDVINKKNTVTLNSSSENAEYGKEKNEEDDIENADEIENIDEDDFDHYDEEFEDLFGGAISSEDEEYISDEDYFSEDIDRTDLNVQADTYVDTSESEEVFDYKSIPVDDQISIEYDNEGTYTISDEFDDISDDDGNIVGADLTTQEVTKTEEDEGSLSNVGELYINVPENEDVAKDEYFENGDVRNEAFAQCKATYDYSNIAISNEELFLNVDKNSSQKNSEHKIPSKGEPVSLTSAEYGDYLQNAIPILPTYISDKTERRTYEKRRVRNIRAESERTVNVSDKNNEEEQLIVDDELLLVVEEHKSDTLVLDSQKEVKRKKSQKTHESRFTSSEYTSPDQNKSIRKKYTSRINATIIRLAICSAITMFMLIFDIWYVASNNEIFEGLFPIIELFMLFAMIVTAAKQLYRGCLAIFDLSPNIYSVPAFSAVILTIYNLALTCVTLVKQDAFDEQKMVMFGCIVGICIICALLSDLMSRMSESDAFDLMTGDEDIYTAVADSTMMPIARGARKSRAYGGSEAFSHTYRVKKVKQVSNFMDRSHKKVGNYGGLVYVLGVLPIIAFIFGCVSGFVNESIETAISSMGFTVFLSLPLSGIIFVIVPYFVAARSMKKEKCAIIGEVSIYECADVQTLVFDDIDAMELTTGIEMKPDAESNIAKSTAIARRVFTSLHLPLSKNYADEMGGSADIVIKSIEANGIEIVMDHSVNVLLGDSSYFAAHDIMVKANSKVLAKYKDHTILYMAINRSPRLAYLVGYKARNEIFEAATKLAGVGVKTFINTYDPGINDINMSSKRPPNAAHIGIFKSRRFEKNNVDDKPDGICISASDPASIAIAIIMSRKIVKNRKLCLLLNYVFVTLGLIISAFIGMIPTIYSAVTSSLDWRILIVLIFQIITMMPCIILSVVQLKSK